MLPLVISLFFTACNDTNQKINAQTEANITHKEQTLTSVKVEKTDKATAQLIDEANSTEINGETIFNKCKSCHGNNAEKNALGASHIIEGWDVTKIENALKGYQNGTYGGSMKNIMAAQAKGLSDEEIKKVAIYIHSL
jgi:cytochrome c553